MLSQQSMLLIDDILAKFCFFFFFGGEGRELAGWLARVLSLSYRDDWMTRLLFTRITTTTKKKKKKEKQTVIFSFGLCPFCFVAPLPRIWR